MQVRLSLTTTYTLCLIAVMPVCVSRIAAYAAEVQASSKITGAHVQLASLLPVAGKVGGAPVQASGPYSW